MTIRIGIRRMISLCGFTSMVELAPPNDAEAMATKLINEYIDVVECITYRCDPRCRRM